MQLSNLCRYTSNFITNNSNFWTSQSPARHNFLSSRNKWQVKRRNTRGQKQKSAKHGQWIKLNLISETQVKFYILDHFRNRLTFTKKEGELQFSPKNENMWTNLRVKDLTINCFFVVAKHLSSCASTKVGFHILVKTRIMRRCHIIMLIVISFN